MDNSRRIGRPTLKILATTMDGFITYTVHELPQVYHLTYDGEPVQLVVHHADWKIRIGRGDKHYNRVTSANLKAMQNMVKRYNTLFDSNRFGICLLDVKGE